MKHSLSIVVLCLGAGLLSGCTTTDRVSVVQPGDRSLTCSELEQEFDQLEALMADAQGDQGVNTANVAAVLLFWPAAVGNYMNADQAMDLARDRQAHLYEIYTEKGCE